MRGIPGASLKSMGDTAIESSDLNQEHLETRSLGRRDLTLDEESHEDGEEWENIRFSQKYIGPDSYYRPDR